ncbi:rHS repeat-associated core domain protein [Firmicutes bacterium CAG:555]|nr:rHS repeat-associated core domain protein [Firmicutes bacterium CAG:555]
MADGSNHFYYYIYNLQGDVIALADASTGKLAVTYTYDAWGKLVELKDTTANSVGTLLHL